MGAPDIAGDFWILPYWQDASSSESFVFSISAFCFERVRFVTRGGPNEIHVADLGPVRNIRVGRQSLWQKVLIPSAPYHKSMTASTDYWRQIFQLFANSLLDDPPIGRI